MKLKKLARYARLGKLKDNSLAHASEGNRLLTFNSQENKNRKNTSRKFPHYMLGSGAVKKLVKSELSHLPAQQNMFLRTKLSRRKTGKNHRSEIRKLMKLKKLAHYARLGKLKDNSLAHASEGCRLLTFNS